MHFTSAFHILVGDFFNNPVQMLSTTTQQASEILLRPLPDVSHFFSMKKLKSL